ncbi:MAG: FliH/SctL family protein [Desulfonatronovibrionaceae bacterium]
MSDAGRTGGRVIMGLQSKALDEVSSQARDAIRLATEENEEKFLARVKEKARAKASEIISQAMAECKEIRKKAGQEGYQEGLTRAGQEIKARKDQLSQDLGSALKALQKEKHKIWQSHRQDITLILKASVEKILGLEINSQRTRVLESLLDQAMEQVEQKKALTLTVCSQDEKLVRELLDKARENNPDLGTCKIKTSSKIKSGGLILENGTGVVDNTIDSRYAQVKEIVDQISLEED